MEVQGVVFLVGLVCMTRMDIKINDWGLTKSNHRCNLMIEKMNNPIIFLREEGIEDRNKGY